MNPLTDLTKICIGELSKTTENFTSTGPLNNLRNNS